MSVEGGDGRTFVAEVDLDLAEVLALFQQMSGVGVAQSVNVGLLFDATGLQGQTEGALESGAAHRFGGGGGALSAVAFGGKEEGGMLVGEPLPAQEQEGAFRQRDVAVVLAFAAAEVEQTALAIDVADFQAQAFAQAQAARVNERQTNPMIQRGDGGQHAANLGSGEDDREFETRIGAGELDLRGPGTAEGFFPKELDRAESLSGSLPGELLLGLEMEEVLAELFGRDQVGRFVEELAEFEDAGPVTEHGAFGQGEQAQIVEEAI